MDRSAALVNTLATRPLIQIAGPNPIVTRGGAGAWDERCIEGGDIFKDFDQGREVYFFYYHGMAKDKSTWPRLGYRVGVSMSTSPLGPFVKAAENPILDLGPQGAWDDGQVACPCIMREGPGKYIMWYSGRGESGPGHLWHIGLATASHPRGPWTKYEGNPILTDFGYVGGVVKVRSTYFMYNEYPVGATSPDYGPLALATAGRPEGPWQKWEGNPVLAPECGGGWDDGGYSEAKVVYHDGLYHVFYGGAKEQSLRLRTLESIGYAISADGHSFTRHVDNPVAGREQSPGASAFAEVKCLFEPPLIYLYHTLRYLDSDDPKAEDLGVQVLATRRPFKLVMPVLALDRLGPGETSALTASRAVNLDSISGLALTVQGACSDQAQSGVRVLAYASDDGLTYEGANWACFDAGVQPTGRVNRTVGVNPQPRFLKVVVENLDRAQDARNLVVTVTLSG